MDPARYFVGHTQSVTMVVINSLCQTMCRPRTAGRVTVRGNTRPTATISIAPLIPAYRYSASSYSTTVITTQRLDDVSKEPQLPQFYASRSLQATESRTWQHYADRFGTKSRRNRKPIWFWQDSRLSFSWEAVTISYFGSMKNGAFPMLFVWNFVLSRMAMLFRKAIKHVLTM